MRPAESSAIGACGSSCQENRFSWANQPFTNTWTRICSSIASAVEKDQMAEILKLRKELAEAKKENDFLKKAAAFFAKELD